MAPRKTPILIRRSGLTGNVYALTRYTEKPHPSIEGETLITASVKHDVTADVEAIVAERCAPLVEALERIGSGLREDGRYMGFVEQRERAKDALARFGGADG